MTIFPSIETLADPNKDYVLFYSDDAKYGSGLNLYAAKHYSYSLSKLSTPVYEVIDDTYADLQVANDLAIYKWTGSVWEYILRDEYTNKVRINHAEDYKTRYATFNKGVMQENEWTYKFPPVPTPLPLEPDKTNWILSRLEGVWTLYTLTFNAYNVFHEMTYDDVYSELKTGASFYFQIFKWDGLDWVTGDGSGGSAYSSFTIDKDSSYRYRIDVNEVPSEDIVTVYGLDNVDTPPASPGGGSGGETGNTGGVGVEVKPKPIFDPFNTADVMPVDYVDARVKRRLTLTANKVEILYFGGYGVGAVSMLSTDGAVVYIKPNAKTLTVTDDSANLINNFSPTLTVKDSSRLYTVAVISAVTTTIQWLVE